VLSDLKDAVFSMRDRGELGDVEAENVYKHLTSLLQRKDIADWFSGENQIYVEKSILVPGKGEFRPDRIIEKGGELIILDYKFGEPRSSHERQLKTYSLAIEKMDYSKVSAYLLYPESGLLLEIE
jgi:ATP-dependent exoDNAse (exonuclease V) beta subunit